MLTPGSDFAGYHIERILGRGGMGDVYLARHPRLPRSDALKLMSEELSRNEVYRQRFSSEADIASQVQHDSVVRVYDRGEDDGRLWIAMEYIDGRDLADILGSEGRLPMERAVALVERIAAGLDAIHARGLLHRDVKPANILVARDVLGSERALLTDFGIARSAADSLGLTGVGDIVATLHYAAPEQFEMRSGDLDRRVDIYALGCVLYEMLTGQVPLQGDSVASFWRVMQSEVPPPPSRYVEGIPPRLDAVVAKALSKQRDDRYTSAGELARAAREAVSGRVDPVPTTPPPVAATAQYPTQAVASAASGSYRVSLRRPDPAVPGSTRLIGPIVTHYLSPGDAQRLRYLIDRSNFFGLPASIIGGYGQATSLTVETPGHTHNVAWAGQPPAALAELVSEVDRLAAPAQSSGPGSFPPVPKPVKRRKRGKLIAALAIVVVLAVAATVTLLAVTGGKEPPGVPGNLRVSAGRGTVTVSWVPGNGKTDHYVVYRDGQVVAPSVSSTTFTDKPSDTATHGYSVQAVNQSGTTSVRTTEAPVAAQVRELNSQEHALVAKLPSALVDSSSCKPILSGVDVHLDTAVTCNAGAGQTPSPPGKVPQVVEAYGAPSATALKAALTDEINTHNAKSGNCATTPQQGTWNFTETPKVINGQIICYTTPGTAFLLWSYTDAQLYVRISTTASYASLLKYWQGAALHLP